MVSIGIIVLAAAVLGGLIFLATVLLLSPQARALGTRVRVAMAIIDPTEDTGPKDVGLPRWLPVLALITCAGFLLGLLLVALGSVF